MKKVKEEEMGRNEDKVKEKKGGEIENVLLYTTTKELWRYEKKEREEKKKGKLFCNIHSHRAVMKR